MQNFGSGSSGGGAQQQRGSRGGGEQQGGSRGGGEQQGGSSLMKASLLQQLTTRRGHGVQPEK
jgi:hypothetical protein